MLKSHHSGKHGFKIVPYMDNSIKTNECTGVLQNAEWTHGLVDHRITDSL